LFLKKSWFAISTRGVTRSVYILALSAIVAVLLALTTYAPDAYVLIRYASQDNILRDIGINSITSNVFIFDLATVIFDLIHISELHEYLLAVVILYLLVFYLKYFHFCADLSLIFTASLMTYDLNQLRFNLALLLFLYSFSKPMSGMRLLLLRGLSFATHILPLLVFYTARFYYFPLLLLPGLIILLKVFDSRFLYYFISVEFIAFKVFLLIIPNIISFWHYKKKHHKSSIAELAFSFNILFIVLIGVNGGLAARFLEAGFYLYVLWWCLAGCRSKVLGGILWFFALAMLGSRLYGGINAGASASFIF
jgi:hypothetical protein